MPGSIFLQLIIQVPNLVEQLENINAYIYLYIQIYCLTNITYPSVYHRNGFTGNTCVWLHVAIIAESKECSRYH